jgi:hypothetical protein
MPTFQFTFIPSVYNAGGGNPPPNPPSSADYLVTSNAELNAALASAGAGEVIRLASSMQGVDLSISGYTKSSVIIDQEVGASVRSVVQTNCTGILWDGITSRYDNEGGPDWAASHNATWQCSGGVLNLLNCTIDNAVGGR